MMECYYNNVSLNKVWDDAIEKFSVSYKKRTKDSASARAAMVEVLKECGYNNRECSDFIGKSYEQVGFIIRQGNRGLGYTTDYYYGVRDYLRLRVFNEVPTDHAKLAMDVSKTINEFREIVNKANKHLRLVDRVIDFGSMDELQVKAEKLVKKGE